VCSAAAGIYAVFYEEYTFPIYEGEKHVFSDVQSNFRQYRDKYIYGIDAPTIATDEQRRHESQSQDKQ